MVCTFICQFFLVDPETKVTIINPILFKVLMIVIVTIITFYGYSKINTKTGISIQTSNTFLALNFLLDIVVLIVLFSVPFMVWATTILPVYILVFYGVCFIIKGHGIQ